MAAKAKTKEAPVVEGEGQFLIVSSSEEGYRTYSGQVGDRNINCVIKPGTETIVDNDFMKVPGFVRDFQMGEIVLRRSNDVPDLARPDLDTKYELNNLQRELARRICYANNPPPPEVEQMIFLHRLLREGNSPTGSGVTVTKRWATTEHIIFLKATLDLESRYKNRSVVLKMLKTAIAEVEAL